MMDRISKSCILRLLILYSILLFYACTGEEQEKSSPSPVTAADKYTDFTTDHPENIPGIWMQTDDYSITILTLSQDGSLKEQNFYPNGDINNECPDGKWTVTGKQITLYYYRNDPPSYKSTWKLSHDGKQLMMSHRSALFTRLPSIQGDIRAYLFKTSVLKRIPKKWVHLEGVSIPNDVPTTVEDLNLIGWSQDGKFAFSQDWYNWGRPSNGTQKIIVDLVTDSILLHVSTDYYPCEGNEKKEMDKTNSGVNRSFEKAIERYGIRRESQEIRNFPVSGVDCYFKARYDTGEGARSINNYYYEWEYELFARKNEKTKLLASGQDRYVLHKKVIGYIQSPFESRIGVVVDTYNWGLEDEYSHSYQIYGCNLEAGFGGN